MIQIRIGLFATASTICFRLRHQPHKRAKQALVLSSKLELLYNNYHMRSLIVIMCCAQMASLNIILSDSILTRQRVTYHASDSAAELDCIAAIAASQRAWISCRIYFPYYHLTPTLSRVSANCQHIMFSTTHSYPTYTISPTSNTPRSSISNAQTLAQNKFILYNNNNSPRISHLCVSKTNPLYSVRCDILRLVGGFDRALLYL